MNPTVLRYFTNEKIKPVYHLKTGEKFLLTARIEPKTDNTMRHAGMSFRPVPRGGINVKRDSDYGLYFLDIISKTKPMFSYTSKGFQSIRTNYSVLNFDTTQIHAKEKEKGVVKNEIFYKKFPDSMLTKCVVLYE